MTTWTDRRVLVTGASRGIGRAVAEHLAASGAAVALTATSVAAAEEARATIVSRHAGAIISAHAYNQADNDAPAALIGAVKAKLGGLDHVVANAGVHSAAPVGMIKSSDIEHLLRVNSGGVLILVQAAMKLMRRSSNASVVLIGSLMANDGVEGQTAYAMSKGAVHGLVRPLSRELGPQGARVNAISPGYIDTDMTTTLEPLQREALEGQTPLGRLGTVADVATAVAFLLSDEASFITGQCLGVDGGLTN